MLLVGGGGTVVVHKSGKRAEHKERQEGGTYCTIRAARGRNIKYHKSGKRAEHIVYGGTYCILYKALDGGGGVSAGVSGAWIRCVRRESHLTLEA